MNGKQVKRLRAVAREATVGASDRAYLRNERTGQVRLDPESTRGTYQHLKRSFKRGDVTRGR